jgi:hypothetical protein
MTRRERFSIRVVTTLEELQTLSVPWNGLLRETTSDNIFLTWEWLYTWCKFYLGTRRLWIILVYTGEDRLIGIAPFYIGTRRAYGGATLREMGFLGTEEVSSMYLDVIVREKHKDAVLHHIFRHLHDEAAELWDILLLSELPADSSSIDRWGALVQDPGKVMEIVGTTICPITRLPSRREDFLNGLSRNARYNLQRKRRRLAQAGSVSYDRVSLIHDVATAMDAFIRLHQIRWEHKGSAGVFRSHRFLMFHREIAVLFAERGWLQLDFLSLNGVAIAGIYGYTYNRRYCFYLPGFDPTVVPHASPGILLLFHRIEEAIREGYQEVDLLRGAEGYKMALANGLRRSLTLRYYNSHVRAAAFKLLESGKDTVKILVR